MKRTSVLVAHRLTNLQAARNQPGSASEPTPLSVYTSPVVYEGIDSSGGELLGGVKKGRESVVELAKTGGEEFSWGRTNRVIYIIQAQLYQYDEQGMGRG